MVSIEEKLILDNSEELKDEIEKRKKVRREDFGKRRKLMRKVD